MYDTLWNIIQSGDYDLPDITRKIDIFYAEGKISDDQRADLLEQVTEHADPERERPDWAEMVERLAERVTALEARLDAGEGEIPDSDKIPAWRPWDGLSALYAKGDKVAHNGKTWVSLVDNNCWEPGIIGTELVWREVTTND